MTGAEQIAADYAHCEAQLRDEDRDRWLASLFIPAERRRYVHAVYAFNLEIARVRTLVSEAMLGEIRFQWWREILVGERASEAQAHPVAAALLDTIAHCDLPADPFLAAISARLFDLYSEPMPSRDMLETYAKATASGLFRIAAEIVAGGGDAAVAEAADHAGIAYAVTGLLRALPWHHAKGQIYVPADMLAAHHSSAAEMRAGKASSRLIAALAELRDLARQHLRAFQAAAKGKAGVAFLPVSLCEAYLRQMEKRDYDPLRTHIELPQWRRQWILWRAARRMR